MRVDFQFEIDQKVKFEKLDITGIIKMCAIDDGGKTYYIETKDGASWFAERHLTIAE